MTEKEFLALVNIVDFEFQSLNNFSLEDEKKEKSIRKDLTTLRDFIKRYGKLLT